LVHWDIPFFSGAFKFVPVSFTPLMLIRVIENKTAGKDAILSHDWEPIENISVNLKRQ
jgi:monofunctional biosynthetic peptidoglycan transglycosylase